MAGAVQPPGSDLGYLEAGKVLQAALFRLDAVLLVGTLGGDVRGQHTHSLDAVLLVGTLGGDVRGQHKA